jgi:hypothetical protein
MFRYIRKHHLFASFASYSLQNIRTDLHTNIRFDAKNTFAANIRFRANIRLRFSHTGEHLLQNIRLEANFHIQTNIRIPANIRYVCFKLFRKAFHKSWA